MGDGGGVLAFFFFFFTLFNYYGEFTFILVYLKIFFTMLMFLQMNSFIVSS